MFKKTVMVLAACILANSAHAEPANRAYVTLSHFKVELTDLAPGDGIAPAIVFAPASGAYLYQEAEYFLPDWEYPSMDTAMFSGYGEHRFTGPGIDVRIATQPFELAVQAAARDDATAVGNAYWELDFTLAPHTQALFSVDVDSSNTLTGRSDTMAEMFAIDRDRYSFMSQANSFEAGSLHRSLTGMVVSGGDERARTLDLSVVAQAWEGTPAVPEPAHYAMLLAGLATVGWRARRRPVA